MTDARPPYSKAALAAFVIAIIGLFIFGVIGLVAVVLGWVGLRNIRTDGLRGRVLAIIAMALGAIDFVFYAISFYLQINA